MILNTGLILLSLTLKDLAVKIRTLTQFAFKHLDLVPGKNKWNLWKFSIDYMEIMEENVSWEIFHKFASKHLYLVPGSLWKFT